MCTLINGATRVRRACLEPAPDAESTAQGMPWRTRCAALAAFQAGALRAFAVPRLALPAEAARLVGGRGGLLRQGVRDDTGRAVGRHLPPAQGPLGVCGTACDREALAGGHGLGVPGARLDTPRRLVPPGGIALAMGRERPGGYVREGRQEHQAGFGGFPWVPQPSLPGPGLLRDYRGQPLASRSALACALAFGSGETGVAAPALGRVGLDIHARDPTAAVEHGCGGAAGVRAHPCARERVVLGAPWVRKEDGALRRRPTLPTDVFPEQSWGDPRALEGARDRVMTALLAVVSNVRQRVVALAAQAILTGIQTSHRFFFILRTLPPLQGFCDPHRRFCVSPNPL